MNTSLYFVGIDVAKLKLDIALLKNGKTKTKVFGNSAEGFQLLQQWLIAQQLTPESTKLCLEATGAYSETIALFLIEQGWCVSVVNPARVKGFAQSELARNKTDRADAALLARFCAALQPEPWQAPPLAYRQLRAWVERLAALKDMHQQEANRQEAMHSSGQAAVSAHIQSHLDWLATEIAKLETDIDDHIDGHPELKTDAELMRSIPGIGARTVAKLLAYAGNVRQFQNAKALAAYAGVTPRQHQSGSSVMGRSMLSRAGNAKLRHALYMPGLVARRHNPTLKGFGDRLKDNGLAPKAVIGAVMRKLLHIIYGVITSGKPFQANFASPRLDLQDGI